MKQIQIWKAQGIREDPPPSIAIIIDQEIGPDVLGVTTDNVLERSEEEFWAQAKLLSEALYDTLPQGTRWRLIVQLMLKEVTLFYGNAMMPLDSALLNWLGTLEDPILFRSQGKWHLDMSDAILESDKFSGVTVREALSNGLIAQAKPSGPIPQVEIISSDGTIETRPINHPDVLEALRTPGHSVRGVSDGSHA